jgi:hypothetical protein
MRSRKPCSIHAPGFRLLPSQTFQNFDLPSRPITNSLGIFKILASTFPVAQHFRFELASSTLGHDGECVGGLAAPQKLPTTGLLERLKVIIEDI